MTLKTMAMLAHYHNMSQYVHSVSGHLRSYLLDINPHYNITTTDDVANITSGRWIDKENGKYLDITALYDNSNGGLSCKDGHRYYEAQLFPLRRARLEGVEVSVPQKSRQLVQQEYGRLALERTHYHWYFRHPLTQSQTNLYEASF